MTNLKKGKITIEVTYKQSTIKITGWTNGKLYSNNTVIYIDSKKYNTSEIVSFTQDFEVAPKIEVKEEVKATEKKEVVEEEKIEVIYIKGKPRAVKTLDEYTRCEIAYACGEIKTYWFSLARAKKEGLVS